MLHSNATGGAYMLKSLRRRMILSHTLPLLVIMPIVGIALIYALETKVLLPDLVRKLTGQAQLVAELAGDRPDIWHSQAQAQALPQQLVQYQEPTLGQSTGCMVHSREYSLLPFLPLALVYPQPVASSNQARLT